MVGGAEDVARKVLVVENASYDEAQDSVWILGALGGYCSLVCVVAAATHGLLQ